MSDPAQASTPQPSAAQQQLPIVIVQLYPEELGVAGDRGNVMAVTQRLQASGLAVTLVEHRVGDILPTDIDLVIVGNGPLSAMRNVYDDLRANATALAELHTAGVPIFAYGSGAELLSRGIHVTEQSGESSAIEGLGLFDFTATRVPKRTVGYVVVKAAIGHIVGFEDSASVWVLEPGTQPLGAVESGGGNGALSGASAGGAAAGVVSTGGAAAEGALSGASIATQIGGPVLPLNPILTDALISSIATRRGLTITPPVSPQADLYAERAREVILSHAKHVFSRI